MKEIPVLYETKQGCSGCGACWASCPQGAIVMEADEEGFFYPTIRQETCIRCGKCLRICPFRAQTL